MAIAKILNINCATEGNPATHLKNALEYIQNPDKTEQCHLVGSVNCLPDTAYEQMLDTKSLYGKPGKRQGYHVIISFPPEESVTPEQAKFVAEGFIGDILNGEYETVYGIHSLKSRYDFDNMSFTKLKSVYKQRTGNTFEDTDYESFGLIDEKGNLTNAGALLADESPVRHSRLFCTRWNGLSKASGIVDALDDKEYTGSLVTLLQDGTDFVRNNSKKAWRKVGDGRIEMPDYPDRAVLEGVVNALIHRNYMEIGSEVHIDMFDDRIEIYSPGGMVSGISLEGKDLLKIPSKRRNPILADIFSRLKYMERRGSGFKKILADYEEQVEFDETKMPVFEADNDDFTLTLYNLNYGSNYAIHANEEKIQGDTQDDTQGDTQDDTEEKIIKMIKDNPQVSTADMAKELKIGIATVKRKIKKMSNVSYVGSGYSGHWEING